MKKLLLSGLCLILVLSAGSCLDNSNLKNLSTQPSQEITANSDNTTVDTQATTYESSAPDTQPTTYETSASATQTSSIETSTDNRYTMLFYTTPPNKDSSIKIQYPYFNGSGFDAVNTLIYEKVQKLVTFGSILEPDEKLDIDYKAAVTLQNSKIISFVIWGDYNNSKTPHPSAVFYTFNIDLSTIKELKITDLYNINADFKKVFYEKKQAPQDNFAHHEQFMIDAFLSGEFTIGEFSYPDNIQFLFNPEGIVISFSIPHAVGDHVEFQLNYSDIQQFYKLNQNYWNS